MKKTLKDTQAVPVGISDGSKAFIFPFTGDLLSKEQNKRQNIKAMKEQLISKLYSYLLENHTDLLVALEEDHRLDHYLRAKVESVRELLAQLEEERRPDYVTEALCLEELTRDLRPSRFNYMRELLEQEFEGDYHRMVSSGILTYELINLTGACEPIFEVFGFGGENEDSKELRYVLTGMIAEYLER